MIPYVLRRMAVIFWNALKSGQFSQEQRALSKLELEALLKATVDVVCQTGSNLWVFADDRWQDAVNSS